MQFEALSLGTAWLAVALIFGFGWLRGGNGSWRWTQDRTRLLPDSPLFGLISFASAVQAFYYLYRAFDFHVGSDPQRVFGWYMTSVPLIATFVAVAIIRRPWGKH
jgi:hypothetical protein